MSSRSEVEQILRPGNLEHGTAILGTAMLRSLWTFGILPSAYTGRTHILRTKHPHATSLSLFGPGPTPERRLNHSSALGPRSGFRKIAPDEQIMGMISIIVDTDLLLENLRLASKTRAVGSDFFESRSWSSLGREIIDESVYGISLGEPTEDVWGDEVHVTNQAVYDGLKPDIWAAILVYGQLGYDFFTNFYSAIDKPQPHVPILQLNPEHDEIVRVE